MDSHMAIPKPPDDWSYDFRHVLNQELDVFDKAKIRKDGQGITDGKPPAPPDQAPGTDAAPAAAPEQDAIARAHAKQLVGLAFSGGGIRSATFNLGVLQSLARMKLLSRFNYLSTVSGGGYIGCWLMAWIKRQEMKDVARNLTPEWVNQPGGKEPPEIRFLRRFSNYLTPKLGWLGADTWTVVAVYIRNLILNLLVLAAAFGLVLLIPRFVAMGSDQLLRKFSNPLTESLPITVSEAVAYFALFALVLAAFCIIWSLRYFLSRKEDRSLPSVPLPALDKWTLHEGFRYFPAKLFDGDFILHLKFAARKRGSCYVRLWAPMKEGEKPGPAAATIRVSDEGIIPPAPAEGPPQTGEIRTGQTVYPPARRAEIQAGSNDLEIVSSEGRCTVRVNDLTVNTVRVRLPKKPWILRWVLRWRRRSFAIGIEDCGKMAFEPEKVERLESASDIGGSQSQVQWLIILPLFLAAFASTFVFGFGDIMPVTTVPTATSNSVADATPLGHATAPITATPRVTSQPLVTATPLVPATPLITATPLVTGTPLVTPTPKVLAFREAAGLSVFATAPKPLDYMKTAAIWCALGVFCIRAALKFWTYIVAGWAAARKALFGSPPAAVTWPPQNDPASWIRVVFETVSITAAAAIGGLIVWALYHGFRGSSVWPIMIWGTPSLIGAFIATIILHIGFMGRQLGDERREWWSRINAWLLIYALAWLAIFGLALCGPLVVAAMGRWIGGVVSISWITSTLLGLIAARSAATRNGQSSGVTDLVAKIAPYIFVLGFFIFLSWAIDQILPLIAGAHIDRTAGGNLSAHPFLSNWWWLNEVAQSPNAVWWVAGVCLGIALVFSVRLDINQFSMHMLYRNRLGRCYLGASNELRRAQPFTGFSPEDDFDLSELLEIWSKPDNSGAPFPIINAALNLVGGKELAWQQRKAASFVFTPLFSGYDFPEQPPGYCPTKQFAVRPSAVTLATAMAISGAAASPNMGYHTSPAPAFLMTVFNVRLGWWLGNPRTKRTWRRSGPLNVLMSLMRELFGLTSEEGKYIYLSDGGHFENLGIYELVRRRCRFIVASDAEEDHAFGFGGLGNAIEKCRSDFGIDIDIDVEPIRRRSEAGYSQWHCAVGRIYYSRVDREGRDGILVYIKSSLTGDEPTDALRYGAANREFPHQTTGDQWFDESQFESYRVLGYHIAQNVFEPVRDQDGVFTKTNEELFVQLSQHWYPPSAPTAESFTKHTQAIIAIYDKLRTNDDLQFLNRDIYPEWRRLFGENPLTFSGLALQRPEITRADLPKSPAELKAGFYVCTAMCDIFEAIYVDLQLEKEFGHPDNRGWMNFFRHWASSPMFRVMWLIGASNYGARFQTFCARHLNLETGCSRPAMVQTRIAMQPGVSGRIPWREEVGALAENIVKTVFPWISGLPGGSEVVSRAKRAVSAAALGSKAPPNHGAREEEVLVKRARDKVIERLNRAHDGKTFSNALPMAKDEMWYEAATLVEFFRRGRSEEELIGHARDRVAALALVDAALIADRVMGKAFQTELNPTERKLIEQFFMFNPGTVSFAKIMRLSMTPESSRRCSQPGQQDLSFPFGFAVLARTEWPPEKKQKRKLVYLRVQNHLRRIGLARKGLKGLLISYPGLEIELLKMHPDADEIPTEQDYARLERIYDSVKMELRQKGRV
jgi:hypothetical protein